ncbi:Hint domain-containing protein [Salibaculum halophilum]|uniref:Hint domain-containing protein n=1 Tax=Salibaculum halophilum TaxID=1914408 RepID=UPI000A108C8E|nr:Hint domain-containing protein [Salibaculum halophilum]
MAKYDFWALGETSVTVSGGGQLDGVNQGDGSHLVGLNITLNYTNFEEITLKDNDWNFDDNDSQQKLHQSQTFDGTTYGNNTKVEAEYQITLTDPNTGDAYQALALNFNNSSPAYGTVEGLVFLDMLPPEGVALKVTDAAEGPGSFGQPSIPEADIVPCFTPGTLIETPDGPRPVETLSAGDMVLTVDNGPQRLTWAGQTHVPSLRLALHPQLRPVLIRAHALGRGRPARDMQVSPQHRILVDGWRAEMLFAEPEVLVAAAHLVNESTILRCPEVREVTYIHLQCAAHEVLISDGLPTESFNPGPVVLRQMDRAARDELQALFPDHDLLDRAPFAAARPMLRRAEAALLAG